MFVAKYEKVISYLDVALASSDREALFEQLAKGEGDVAFGGVGVRGAGVLGDVKTWNAETTGGTDDGDEGFEDSIGLLGLAVSCNGLVSDGVDTAIHLASEVHS